MISQTAPAGGLSSADRSRCRRDPPGAPAALPAGPAAPGRRIGAATDRTDA